MADIRALYADEDGNILDAPKGFQALARTGTDIIELSPDDLIPLPESADLMFLPDRLPLAKYGDEIMPIMGNAVAASCLLVILAYICQPSKKKMTLKCFHFMAILLLLFTKMNFM